MINRHVTDIITILKNDHPKQTILSLNNTVFDNKEQFVHFCNALVNNQSICSLEFSGCNMENINSLEPLFIAIAHNKKLKILNFSNWPVIKTHLDMLSDALSTPCGKSIVELNLSNCQISDNYLSKLNFLTFNRTLQKLILSNNKINTSGAIGLAKQLKHAQLYDRALMAIDRESANHHHLAEATAELQFTAKNTSLLELDLNNNTAKKSKFFHWDDILKNIHSALEQNNIEENKRHPKPAAQTVHANAAFQSSSTTAPTKEASEEIKNPFPDTPPAMQQVVQKNTSTLKPKPNMDVSKLALPKNLAHQSHHGMTKTNPAQSKSQNVKPLEEGPRPPLFPALHELSKSTLMGLMGFMSGAGGLGVGVIISAGFFLGGLIASGPVGWAILGGIVAGCTVIGAGAGVLVAMHTTLMPPAVTSSSAVINMSLGTVEPRKRDIIIEENVVERAADPRPSRPGISFGGALYLTGADLRRPRAERERKIALNTLMNSNV